MFNSSNKQARDLINTGQFAKAKQGNSEIKAYRSPISG